MIESSTQSIEAVVVLLKLVCEPVDPLPEAVQLTGVVLVLSSRRDSYYVVSAKACSCPSFIYRGGPSSTRGSIFQNMWKDSHQTIRNCKF
jgi:hypothetical protein